VTLPKKKKSRLEIEIGLKDVWQVACDGAVRQNNVDLVPESI
jgi:hypothetical protein